MLPRSIENKHKLVSLVEPLKQGNYIWMRCDTVQECNLN